ncbi:hypothetical protein AGMMS4957_21060 [Bacteroidia bacterium]|nr:hypothetical protein AGMMS4957_21060 [Bacteroidia bacterium]
MPKEENEIEALRREQMEQSKRVDEEAARQAEKANRAATAAASLYPTVSAQVGWKTPPETTTQAASASGVAATPAYALNPNNPYRGKVAQPEAPNTLSDYIEKYQKQLDEKKRDVEHRRQSSGVGLLTDLAVLLGDQHGANNNARVNVREMSGQQQAQEADRLYQDYMAAKNRLPDIENQLKLQEYQRQLGLYDKNNALADAWDKQDYDAWKWEKEQERRAAEAAEKKRIEDEKIKIGYKNAEANMIRAKRPVLGRGGSKDKEEKYVTDLVTGDRYYLEDFGRVHSTPQLWREVREIAIKGMTNRQIEEFDKQMKTPALRQQVIEAHAFETPSLRKQMKNLSTRVVPGTGRREELQEPQAQARGNQQVDWGAQQGGGHFKLRSNNNNNGSAGLFD